MYTIDDINNHPDCKGHFLADENNKPYCTMTGLSILCGVPMEDLVPQFAKFMVKPSPFIKYLIKNKVDIVNIIATGVIPSFAITASLHYYSSLAGRKCTKQAQYFSNEFLKTAMGRMMADD